MLDDLEAPGALVKLRVAMKKIATGTQAGISRVGYVGQGVGPQRVDELGLEMGSEY